MRCAAALTMLVIGTVLPQQPMFHAGVDAVSVDVSVRKGKTSVSGLDSGDFALVDNGAVQRVEAVTVDSVPIDVTVVLDVSGSVGSLAVRRSADVVRRIAALLRPVDRLRVVSFGTDVQEAVPLQSPTSDIIVPFLSADGSTSLNDALIYTFITTHPVPNRRQLMVIFTDGYENSSLVGDTAMREVARRLDTLIHIVVPTNQVTIMAQQSGGVVSRETLIQLAVASGGEPHDLSEPYRGPNGTIGVSGELAVTTIVETFQRIFDDFRQSYVLYYTLRGVPRAGWHDITVKVVAPGGEKYTVRARKGYFGG